MKIHNLSDHPECIPILAEWHFREWQHLNPARTIEKRIEFLHRCTANDDLPLMLVAVDEQGSPAGTAALVEHDMDTRTNLSPWLASVFVAPPFRRRGIGSQLVQAVMTAGAKAKFETLYLFTTDQAPLYSRLGWHKIATEPYHGHQVVVMQWHSATD